MGPLTTSALAAAKVVRTSPLATRATAVAEVLKTKRFITVFLLPRYESFPIFSYVFVCMCVRHTHVCTSSCVEVGGAERSRLAQGPRYNVKRGLARGSGGQAGGPNGPFGSSF